MILSDHRLCRLRGCGFYAGSAPVSPVGPLCEVHFGSLMRSNPEKQFSSNFHTRDDI